jgi:hypothetical protein
MQPIFIMEAVQSVKQRDDDVSKLYLRFKILVAKQSSMNQVVHGV